MIKGNLTIPSEVNQYDFTINTGLQWDTSNAPFTFFEYDSITCEKTPHDLTNQDFEVKVYFNDCLIYELGPAEIIKGTDPEELHKMFVLTTGLNLKKGNYKYIVFFTGTASVIKGNLKAI